MTDAGRLQTKVTELGAWLAIWDTRSKDGADAHQRRSASHAVDAIDVMMGRLYEIRSRLIAEIRADDDKRGAHVDARIAESRLKLASTSDGSPNPLIAHPPAGTWTEGLPAKEGRKYT